MPWNQAPWRPFTDRTQRSPPRRTTQIVTGVPSLPSVRRDAIFISSLVHPVIGTPPLPGAYEAPRNAAFSAGSILVPRRDSTRVMDKAWPTHGQERRERRFESGRIAGQRSYNLERTTIRTRDPHLGKGARFVQSRLSPFILQVIVLAAALAALSEPRRTTANEAVWGQIWGQPAEMISDRLDHEFPVIEHARNHSLQSPLAAPDPRQAGGIILGAARIPRPVRRKMAITTTHAQYPKRAKNETTGIRRATASTIPIHPNHAGNTPVRIDSTEVAATRAPASTM